MFVTLAKFFGVPGFVIWIGAALLGAGGLWLSVHLYNNHVIAAEDTRRDVRAAGARDKAADEQVTDAAINAANEKEAHDAIDHAPAGTIDPAAHALACDQLRRAKRSIPASCGHQGGN